MCTVIVTIRAVLWYVVSLAGTLMILVALFTNRWLEGKLGLSNVSSPENLAGTVQDTFNNINQGDYDMINRHVGLFMDCKEPEGTKFFEGECIPDPNDVQSLFTNLDDREYPHAWRGAVICFLLGLALMILIDTLMLLTVCCRGCLCCSVFTVCGSIQSFAALLFTLGLIAYPAGWGSQVIKDRYCEGQSGPFVLGPGCSLGIAFWLAVAGTVCTCVASSLAIWAYQSTKTGRLEQRQDEGEKCICGP